VISSGGRQKISSKLKKKKNTTKQQTFELPILTKCLFQIKPVPHKFFRCQKALAKKRKKKVKRRTEWKYILCNIICLTVVNVTFLWLKKKIIF